jgi:ribosomal protein S6
VTNIGKEAKIFTTVANITTKQGEESLGWSQLRDKDDNFVATLNSEEEIKPGKSTTLKGGWILNDSETDVVIEFNGWVTESGAGNVKVMQDVSRHETSTSLEDFISIGANMLNSEGSFYMVNRVERMAEIFEIMRKYKIEPKILRFIYSNVDSEGKLFLIKGVKNGRKFLKVLSPLIMYKEDGSYTDEVLKIYGKI